MNIIICYVYWAFMCVTDNKQATIAAYGDSALDRGRPIEIWQDQCRIYNLYFLLYAVTNTLLTTVQWNLKKPPSKEKGLVITALVKYFRVEKPEQEMFLLLKGSHSPTSEGNKVFNKVEGAWTNTSLAGITQSFPLWSSVTLPKVCWKLSASDITGSMYMWKALAHTSWI